MDELVGLCAIGAEHTLGLELKYFGFSLTRTKRTAGRVYFSADLAGLFKANLLLSTCDRVYLLLASFQATNFEVLFKGTKSIPWAKYLPKAAYVVVDKVRTHNSILHSEHAVQTITHKAICESLQEAYHMASLPESGEAAFIRVYIEKDTVELLLDTSGDPLYKRGYRQNGGVAPLRETLAATLLHTAAWKRKTPLIDPFCGSGTIPIEAAIFAQNIPPGVARHFAFENLLIFNKRLFADVKLSLLQAIKTDAQFMITGGDISHEAISLAKQNAQAMCASVNKELQSVGIKATVCPPTFVQGDFQKTTLSFLHSCAQNILVLTNPPYGERIGDAESAFALYQEMGDFFKQNCFFSKTGASHKENSAKNSSSFSSNAIISQNSLSIGLSSSENGDPRVSTSPINTSIQIKTPCADSSASENSCRNSPLCKDTKVNGDTLAVQFSQNSASNKNSPLSNKDNILSAKNSVANDGQGQLASNVATTRYTALGVITTHKDFFRHFGLDARKTHDYCSGAFDTALFLF